MKKLISILITTIGLGSCLTAITFQTTNNFANLEWRLSAKECNDATCDCGAWSPQISFGATNFDIENKVHYYERNTVLQLVYLDKDGYEQVIDTIENSWIRGLHRRSVTAKLSNGNEIEVTCEYDNNIVALGQIRELYAKVLSFSVNGTCLQP